MARIFLTTIKRVAAAVTGANARPSVTAAPSVTATASGTPTKPATIAGLALDTSRIKNAVSVIVGRSLVTSATGTPSQPPLAVGRVLSTVLNNAGTVLVQRGVEIVQTKIDLVQTNGATGATSTGSWSNAANAQGVRNGTVATNANTVTVAASGNLDLTYAAQPNKTALTITSATLRFYHQLAAGIASPSTYTIAYSTDAGGSWTTIATGSTSFNALTTPTDVSITSLLNATTTPDSGPSGRTGTLVGSTLPSLVTSPFSGYGNALLFDGVDRDDNSMGVQVAQTGLVPTAGFSVRQKFRKDRATSAANGNGTGNFYEILSGVWGSNPVDDVWLLFLSYEPSVVAADRLQFVWYDAGGTIRILISSNAPSIGNHEAQASFDGSTMRLFLDGALVASMASTSIRAGSGVEPFRIGRYMNTSVGTPYPLQGVIDEVEIANVARNTAAYTPASAPYTSDANTLLLWHLDSTTAGSDWNKLTNLRTRCTLTGPASATVSTYTVDAVELVVNATRTDLL